MTHPPVRRLLSLGILAAAITLGPGGVIVALDQDQPLETGPDVVILRELEEAYEPVPFDHLTHAKMAQMWNGCVTCHHRPPRRTVQVVNGTTMTVVLPVEQDESAEIPACKSCHPVSPAEPDIHMPSLKAAYHRQCLNCHKEWMHENACVICHEPKGGRQRTQGPPMPDDIVGRMHPPIPEPEDVVYKTRFTPADGGNVLFRHRGHTTDFGIRCVDCHHQDNCSHCHGPTGDTTAQKPLHPGMTWDESHGPCMGCHSQARCRHCHYRDDQAPPRPFDHTTTGQTLDKDHIDLACSQCHLSLEFEITPTCGDADCHKGERIDYPAQFPGPVLTPTPESSGQEGELPRTAGFSTGNDPQ